MALGVSRLLLSLSAMKRSSSGVAADYLFTQSEDFIITQNGWRFLANQSRLPTTKPDPISIITLQDGVTNIISQDGSNIGAEQYIENAADIQGTKLIITQTGEVLLTQDGDTLLENAPLIFNLLELQNGDILATQEGAPIAREKNEEILYEAGVITTQYGLTITNQTDTEIILQQIIEVSGFPSDPYPGPEELELVLNQGGFLLTQSDNIIELQDRYIAA